MFPFLTAEHPHRTQTLVSHDNKEVYKGDEINQVSGHLEGFHLYYLESLLPLGGAKSKYLMKIITLSKNFTKIKIHFPTYSQDFVFQRFDWNRLPR